MHFPRHGRAVLIAAGLSAAVIGIASADTPATATTDLNVRAGPGSQYPVIGVINAGESAMLTGCVRDSLWCTVDENGRLGFVHSDYLDADIGGSRVIVAQRPANSDILFVDPPAEGSIEVLDGSTGSIRGELIGRVEDIDVIEPPEAVGTYVAANRVDAVYLDGEVVVGAGLPDTVQLVEIPDYDYEYVYVNGQPVLVEPTSRRIVYVYR